MGTFYQPSFVCADVDTLATLPEREWRCGCAEVAKSAVIDSDDFFFWLLDHAEAMAARDADVAAEAIQRCVVFKAGVVARDKTESAGVRECLNYGHTLGHAIEACTGYGTFSHGAAVAEGMRFAARLPSGARRWARSTISRERKPSCSTRWAGARSIRCDARRDLLDAMKRDKKVRGGQLRFVLARDVATWQVVPCPTTTAYCGARLDALS